MAINLQKGQRENINAQKFTIGLGWDTNASSTGAAFDLDASVFLLSSKGKIVSDEYFIFYNNTKSPDGAVVHTGDNQTGAGDGDDESVTVDLSKINSAVEEICIVVTIHEAESRKQNFGQVRNSFIRIYDEKNTELVKYELDEDFSVETGVEFGRLYKRDGKWKFEASGIGYKQDLSFFLSKYYKGEIIK